MLLSQLVAMGEENPRLVRKRLSLWEVPGNRQTLKFLKSGLLLLVEVRRNLQNEPYVKVARRSVA